MTDIIGNQLQTLGGILKQNDYHGFQYSDCTRMSDRDSYQFRFVGDVKNPDTINKYFILEVSHSALVNMKMEDVYSYIHNSVINHPDIKKAAHHQEFYKKFDEILK